MTFVSNVKRRFRRSCIIIAFFAMCFLVGCGSKLTTRAYPLGRYPETTKAIVDEIATDEIAKHIDEEQQRPSRKLYTLTAEHIVVKTTLEGHRQIEASLQDIEEQPTAPRED
jgi:hypothetical protein